MDEDEEGLTLGWLKNVVMKATEDNVIGTVQLMEWNDRYNDGHCVTLFNFVMANTLLGMSVLQLTLYQS